MPKIKQLSDTLINKIAAGEVIERPASVVKELIENALDAGSTDIRIEVLKGGKRLIRVSDNGEGMDREDARMCLERHATSKVFEEKDLSSIGTLGFRGEALSSIAAVSKVRLSTVKRGADVGVFLDIEDGTVLSEKEAAGTGTTIEVRDLFFNTPVRRKFMKTDGTELYHVIDAVTRAAVINNSVRFLLTSDRKNVLDLYCAQGFGERLMSLYGPEFMAGMIRVDLSKEWVGTKIEGYISIPAKTRRTRGHQYLYVNRRPVTDKALRHALYKGYEGYLSGDEHPLFFLNISVDPGSIDVNVHPAKREIRFLEREDIYNTILDTVKGVLRETGPRASEEEDEGTKNRFTGTPRVDLPAERNATIYEPGNAETVSDTIAEPAELLTAFARQYIYIGDVFVAYVDGGALCVLDHHAAHERVMYEHMKNRVDLDQVRLLFPKQVRLNPKEYEVLLRYSGTITEMGIELEDFGGHTVIVRAIPSAVREEDLEGILSDIAHTIMDFRASSPLEAIKDGIAKSVACHSSVRGARILGKEHLNRLLSDLDMTEDPHHCPHGRPTRVYYSVDDLKKIFERT